MSQIAAFGGLEPKQFRNKAQWEVSVPMQVSLRGHMARKVLFPRQDLEGGHMQDEKGIRVPIYRVSDLKARTVKAARARRVKGGPISWPNDPRRAGAAAEILPAVQRARS